jgi:hypothetical protein
MFPVKRPCGSPQRSPPSPAPTPEKVSFSWPEPRGGWHAGNLTGLGVARAELRVRLKAFRAEKAAHVLSPRGQQIVRLARLTAGTRLLALLKLRYWVAVTHGGFVFTVSLPYFCEKRPTGG